MTDSELLAEVLKLRVVKLILIVCHNGIGNTKTADDVCSNERRDLG